MNVGGVEKRDRHVGFGRAGNHGVGRILSYKRKFTRSTDRSQADLKSASPQSMGMMFLNDFGLWNGVGRAAPRRGGR